MGRQDFVHSREFIESREKVQKNSKPKQKLEQSQHKGTQHADVCGDYHTRDQPAS